MLSLKKIICLIILIRCLGLGAQNLVPNPSFETYTSCPTGFSQLNKAYSWYGTNNSSEYFNSCASGNINIPNTAYGYQLARTGNAFAGQYFINGYGTNYREYIQCANFISPLVAGNCYWVKFHVNSPNKIVYYACNNIAAHLSVLGYLTSGSPATSYTPQIYLVNNPIAKDTLGWVEIGGIYTAVGGENHITIGNFKNDANTDTLRINNGTYGVAYYYIDDVSVEQITTPQWQLRDTMILVGDSVLIGPLYSGLQCSWYNMSGTQIGTGSGMWVKPNTTTSYVLHETICGNTFADTMTVFVSAVGMNENKINNLSTKIYPNPSNGSFNIEIKDPSLDCEFNIEIFDLVGKLVFSSKQILKNKNNLIQSNLESGTYILMLIPQNSNRSIHKLIIQN